MILRQVFISLSSMRRDYRRLDEQSPASFELADAAKHVGEIDHLEEAHAPAQ